MTQQCFALDGKRCNGCRTCTMACKDYFDLPAEISFRKTYEYVGGQWEIDAQGCNVPEVFAYYVNAACNHCDNPACVQACPVGALIKDDGTGLVYVDENTCDGCGACSLACPYEVPHVDESQGICVKCDGCRTRVAEGKLPICVQACPQRALSFLDRDEISALGDDFEQLNVAPFPSPDMTGPNYFVKAGIHYRPADDESGYVANPDEVA